MKRFTVLRTADTKWLKRKGDGTRREPQHEFHEKKLAWLWGQKAAPTLTWLCDQYYFLGPWWPHQDSKKNKSSVCFLASCHPNLCPSALS